jgi:hypothetical protein
MSDSRFQNRALNANTPTANETRKDHFWQVRTCSENEGKNSQRLPKRKEAEQNNNHMMN